LVLAPSEYFAVGAGASEAVTKAGVPWVTVQHGVVNRTYAPSIADEYWVWTDEAASAMKTLLARGSQRVSVVGPLRFASQGQGSPGRTALSCSSGPRERTIVLFSQTHGLEYDKHVHEVLAVQVRRVLDRVADSRLIIKLHPSEHHSFYEELIGYGERVNVVSGAAVTATEAAKAGSCCLAFDSTALLEAILVGTVAVKVDSPCGGMAIQPVAAHTVRLDGVAIFVEALLTSEKRMEAALARQEERLPSLVPSTERAQVLWKEGIRRLCGEVLQ
jgi:hypothetical protein